MKRSLIRRRSGADCTRGNPSRAVPGRSLRASFATLLLVPQLSGCYHHVPISGQAVTTGSDVSLGITDQGRVVLSPMVGPGVLRINGRVLERTESALVLSVASVRYLDSEGSSTRWTGERLEVGRDLVAEVGERRLSRSRTGIMAALVVAGTVAASFLGIVGFGSGEGGDRPGGGDPPQQ